MPRIEVPTISGQRAGRQPGDDGLRWRSRWSGSSRRSPASPRSPRSAPRERRSHAGVRPQPQTSTRPRSTCSRRSRWRWRDCRPSCRRRPAYRKVNPADSPIIFLALTSDDRAAGDQRVRRQGDEPEAVDAAGRGAGQHPGRPEDGPCASSTISTRWRRAGSRRGGPAARDRACPSVPIGSVGRARRSTSWTIRGAGRCADLLQAAGGGLAQRRAGAARGYRQGRRLRRERQGEERSSTDAARSSLAVQRQPDANTVAVTDAVHRVLPEFERLLPPTIKLSVLSDRSESIRNSVHDVQLTDADDGAGRHGHLPLPAQPGAPPSSRPSRCRMSIIGTFAGMSMLASLSTTDAAGTHARGGLRRRRRHRHAREHRSLHRAGHEAVRGRIRGATEIGFTVLSITMSLVAVFIPILFMGGIVGRFFFEFAMTISIAIAAVGLRLADADADALLAPAQGPPRRREEAQPPRAPSRAATI